MIKTCVICNTEKPSSEFAFRRRNQDKRRNYCKHCGYLRRLKAIGGEYLCVGCGVTKPVSDFARHSRDGIQNRCKSCVLEADRARRRNRGARPKVSLTPEERRAKQTAKKRARKELVQIEMLRYLLSHPCVDCGMSDPLVLEFDHLRDKKRSAKHMPTMKSFREEVAKCEVRCASCHRRRHMKDFEGVMRRLAIAKGAPLEEAVTA